MAGCALDLIKVQAPDFKRLIIEQTVVSPLDLVRENPNLVGDDQVCGSHHLSQNLIVRPTLDLTDGRTSIPVLHLIGAATWRSGGSDAAFGFMKARET